MEVGAWAAVASTAVFAVVTLVLGRAALRAHGEALRAGMSAERSLSIGDRRGHRASQTYARLLRRLARRCTVATASTLVLMLGSAVAATFV